MAVIQSQYRTAKQEKRMRVPIVSNRNRNRSHDETLGNATARIALERSRAGKALQVLTGRLMEAQEEERRRIGRELHDGLNQQLAMFAVELGLLARQAPKGNIALIESISNLRKRAESLSEDLRHFSHQLHPAVLEHLGLHSALRSLCEDFRRNYGISVGFAADADTHGVPRDIAISLYRITQEALRNVARHSRASEAWIKISRISNVIQLSIMDKGVGFDLRSTTTTGLGLISMEERVQIIRGHFSIETASNAGTEIRITVPITWKEH
ncbi:MAG TPA: sensor histidine kinase [Terriglobia bacterium]|nr:sensor histidine kinase [Terriglobia bacterium]